LHDVQGVSFFIGHRSTDKSSHVIDTIVAVIVTISFALTST